MEKGTRINHKTLGKGTVQPYINFDGTSTREETYRENGIVFVKLDNPPAGWRPVVSVDVEACTVVSAPDQGGADV
ncbi:hypothetical protein [Geomonas subterranea]|uniref:hypothetical protein n=1 Tax=Geomonas subterranea TaxID=2847989 RepID=UPI001CD68C87|nr:hypothetical protein [Geomonas fuzhouensis]